MTLGKIAAALKDEPRFDVVPVVILRVQVPQSYAEAVLGAITEVCALRYGDYDHVSFEGAAGTQRFRSTGAGRNAATIGVARVPCTVLSMQVPQDADLLSAVLCAVYHVHPYEEPVIDLTPALGTRHVRGMDEDNHNRFWNGDTPDWVPPEHR